MSQPPRIDLNALWKYVTDQVKQQVMQPTLWRALEAGKPITLEEDQLVVGYAGNSAHHQGLVDTDQNRNMLEQVLERATRKRLRLRVISGDSVQDWDTLKATEVEAARLKELSRQQLKKQVEAGDTWEAVGEQLVQTFITLRNKGLPTTQGRYLADAVRRFAEAYVRLMPETPSEQEERAYCRAVDRIAERTGVPAPVIVYMVEERLRKE